jgi:DnaJ family protein A protein 5
MQRLSKKQKKKKRQNKQEKEEENEEDEEETEQTNEQPTIDDNAENLKEENTNEEVQVEDKLEQKMPPSTSKTSDEQVKLICTVCQEEFSSRNKLFDHIKAEGHAAPKLEKPLSHNAMKKNKRLAKTIKK